jgi:hypothetical protein
MKAFNYKRLLDITNTVPSFRGNVNRFPIGERRQNNKYFLRRDEDGYTVFDIVYGETWNSTEIDRLEYIRLKLEHRKFRKATGTERAQTYVMKWKKHTTVGGVWTQSKEFEYHRRDRGHNIVGTVRPDNSFEFTKSRYWQGDRCFLSQSSAGYFSTDSRRGGMVFAINMQDDNAVFHPIWKGLRVNCDTMEAVTPYEVVIHHVDRKSGKGILSKYEHMFKVSEVMLKAMDLHIINNTCIEIVDGIFGAGEYKRSVDNAKLLEHAEKLIDDAPLDALLLFTLAYEVRHVGYRMRYGMSTTNHTDDTPENIFMATKRKIAREVYKENPDILKEVSCGSGKRYPACDWGVKLMVNGQQVEQAT